MKFLKHLNFLFLDIFFEIPGEKIASLQLHLLSDTNTIAFGTIGCLRVSTPKKNIRIVFVDSENRVWPLKILIISRLKLMVALNLTNLSCMYFERAASKYSLHLLQGFRNNLFSD